MDKSWLRVSELEPLRLLFRVSPFSLDCDMLLGHGLATGLSLSCIIYIRLGDCLSMHVDVLPALDSRRIRVMSCLFRVCRIDVQKKR